MNGGFSLAVWMGGVGCEIDNVRRASNGIPPRDGATEQEKTVHELWARATQRAGTALDSLFGLDGHYVRIGPDPQYGLARIANQPHPDYQVAASSVLGLEFAYLARLGLRSANDKKLSDTASLIDVMLARNVGTGTGYYRYDYDGYGEQVDGANFSGTGAGRIWPLLAGERGHLAVLAGADGLAQLTTILKMRTPSGLLPEQVWDQSPLYPQNGIPTLPLITGQRTLSATPLAWAHSELIKLAWTRTSKTPAEQLTAVTTRYGGQKPAPSTSHWRSAAPLTGLVAGRNLTVEDTQPFTLHYGFGDLANWTEVTDANSVPLPFGMHGLTITAAQLNGHTSLNFIRRYGSTWDPKGNQNIPIVASAPTTPKQPLTPDASSPIKTSTRTHADESKTPPCNYAPEACTTIISRTELTHWTCSQRYY